MTYEELDKLQEIRPVKVFDLQGQMVNLPEVLEMLKDARIPKISCRCDYETAGALHEWLQKMAVVSNGTSEDADVWFHYQMVGYPFRIWLGRFKHVNDKPRRMMFDEIAMLVSFQPKFDWTPEFTKVPWPFPDPLASFAQPQ